MKSDRSKAKSALNRMKEIDKSIRNHKINKNPIFKNFDNDLNKALDTSKKSIYKIRASIQNTKQ